MPRVETKVVDFTTVLAGSDDGGDDGARPQGGKTPTVDAQGGKTPTVDAQRLKWVTEVLHE